MQYTRLGPSGLTVSRICLGTMNFGDGSRESWALDYDAAKPLFQQALDLGITFWTPPTSTASAPPRPSSAKRSWISRRRDDIVVATR